MNHFIIKNVLKNLGNHFDSHDFIRKYAFLYQQDYIRLLAKYVEDNPEDKSPFQNVHSMIINELADSNLVVKYPAPATSHDIFGHSNEVESWEKAREL